MAKAKDKAEEYGFATAFFNSDPELKKLFAKAVKVNMPSQAFVAALQATSWFKHHSSAYRQNLAQSTSDPATWKARTAQSLASLADTARSMGAVLSSAQLKALNDHALMFGYTDAQVKNSLASYITQNNAGNFTGQAGADALTLKQSAFRNGINISDASMQSWVRSIEAGNNTPDDYVSWIRDQAKTLAPGFAKQLESGMDLADIASPYMQSMSKILELDPADITLFDPSIRKALNVKQKDGTSTSMGLGDYENTLRQDPRWMKTQNAQDTFATEARGVLSSFGFLS